MKVESGEGLCESAKATIRELRERHCIEPTVDEQVILNRLCERMENPSGAPHAGLAGAPVRVGSVTLWPLTIGASMWFLDVAIPLLGGEGQGASFALAYAMAHARSPDVLWLNQTPEAIRDSVRKWKQDLGVRTLELFGAVACVTAQQQGTPPAQQDKDSERIATATRQRNLQRLVIELCKEFAGTTPDYWYWERSMPDVLDHIFAVREQQRAKSGATAPHEPSVMALRVVRAAVSRIIASRTPVDHATSVP